MHKDPLTHTNRALGLVLKSHSAQVLPVALRSDGFCASVCSAADVLLSKDLFGE